MAKRILDDNRKLYSRYMVSNNRRKTKIKLLELKGGKCELCGYSASVNALCFHHKNPSEKSFTISDMYYKNFDEIKKEVDKCSLLCRNCHAEEHDNIRNSFSDSKKISTKTKSILKIRLRNKNKAIQHKGGCCQACGYSASSSGLTFHHVNKYEKSFQLSSENLTKSWDAILAELNKCELLCHNCHAELHDEEFKLDNKLSYDKIRAVVKGKIKNTSVQKDCDFCRLTFSLYSSRVSATNFCSRDCKNKYFSSFGWPSDHDMILLLKTKTIEDLCKILGKSKSSIYLKIKKLNSTKGI